MAKAKTTVTIEGKAAEKLSELTAASGRSADFYVAYMIEEYAARELRIIGEMKAARERVANGEGIPHEEVMAEIDAIIEAAASRAHRPVRRRATK
jgi:predicted transcriptional regulator